MSPVARSRRWKLAAAVAPLVEPIESRVLMSAGQLDTSFGTAGQVRQNVTPPVTALAVQPNGDVISTTFEGVRRLLPNGTVDPTFVDTDTSGIVPTQAFVLPDGDVLLAGSGSLVELTGTGAVNTAYGTNGVVTLALAATDVAVDLTGAAYVLEPSAGNDTLYVAKYTPAGRVATAYDNGGVSDLDAGEHVYSNSAAITVDAAGAVVAAVGVTYPSFSVFGSPTYGCAVTEIAPDGTPQHAAAYGDGSAFTSATPITATAVALGTDATPEDYGTNGTVYAAFTQGTGTTATSAIVAVDVTGDDRAAALASEVLPAGATVDGLAVQADGKLVAVGQVGGTAGRSQELVDRFEPATTFNGGGPDLSFNGTGSAAISTDTSDAATGVVLDPDGDVLVSGFSDGRASSDTTLTAVQAGPVAAASAALTGTVIGTPGSYANGGNTAAHAFDGNPGTYVDAAAASGSYAGLDLGSPQVVNQIAFAPRAGYAYRMAGGVFQGSNDPTFATATTLYVVKSTPAAGITRVAVDPSGSAFRYVRYVGPANGYGDIAEAQFFGAPLVAPGSVTLANGVLTVSGTAAADTIAVTLDDDIETTPATSSITVSLGGSTQTFAAAGITSLVINAGDGNDTVTVGVADTEFDDQDGSPLHALALSVEGGAGDDTIHVGLATDEDDAYLHIGSVFIDGGDGGDTITYDGETNSTLHGGAGDDSITATGGMTTSMYGDDGNDTLSAFGYTPGYEYAHMDGGAGNDTFSLSDIVQFITVTGGAGTDTLLIPANGTGDLAGSLLDLNGDPSDAGMGRNVIFADGSTENVTDQGNEQDVEVIGNAADNVLDFSKAEYGNLTLLGNGGDDTLMAGFGNATALNGGDGNDTLVAGTYGATTFIGGAGTDLADYSAYTAGVTVHFDGQADSGLTSGPTDTVGTDVEQVATGSGNDVIYADDGRPETINGGAGTDTAYVDATGDTTANVEDVVKPTPATHQLTGTTIGTPGAYGNSGNTIAKATDGNLNTYFDAPTASGAYVGIDLGSTQVVTQVKFAPRSGYASRMVGGVFQASSSATFANAVTVYTVGSTPAQGVLTTVNVSAGSGFRYWRYVGPANGECDIAEFQLYGTGTTTPTATRLTGTTIGTAGSYQNQGNTIAKATDGNLNTFFDAPTASGSYVGLDLGAAHVVTQIGFAPRSGYASRMVGGSFQASSTADFANAVTVYTVTVAPASGTVTTVAVSAGAAYRYWRYVGPANSNCNIAELQLFGY